MALGSTVIEWAKYSCGSQCCKVSREYVLLINDKHSHSSENLMICKLLSHFGLLSVGSPASVGTIKYGNIIHKTKSAFKGLKN